MADVEVTNIRVSYRLGATIKTGDFSNIKPEYEISADVPDGTSPTAVKEKLKRTIVSWLEQDMAEAGKKS